jgi:competence protein ComEC
VAQFRLDVRDAAAWLAARLPFSQPRAGNAARAALAGSAATMLRLWEVFLVSAAIQLGMQPVMAAYFHQVSVAGLAANIPASLLSAAIVPLGFLALALNAAWAWAGALCGAVVGTLAAAMLAAVEWFSRVGWSAWRVPAPPAWLLIGHAAALVGLAAALRAKRRWWAWASAAALAAATALVATHPFAVAVVPGKLEITTLDVGQGDAIFAAFPDGRTLLLDGGGLFGTARAGGFRTGLDVGEQVVSPYLWSLGVQRLDVVALSHAHQDHLDGLHAVLENFRVGELWVGRDVASAAYRALLESAARRGVRVVHLGRGDEFAWGSVRGAVLWPEAPEGDPQAQARNNDSLVLRLHLGRTSALLAGDIERDVEKRLVAEGAQLDVDFLKVPHHGSRTSATREFIEAVTPLAAAISLSGTNPFGHPHPEVLERLRASGARVLRTDRDGAVTFVSDGKTWSVRGFMERRE